jgi:hypothetical protein
MTTTETEDEPDHADGRYQVVLVREEHRPAIEQLRTQLEYVDQLQRAGGGHDLEGDVG